MTENKHQNRAIIQSKHSTATYRREAVIRGHNRAIHIFERHPVPLETVMKAMKKLSTSELGEIADYVDELRWEMELSHSDEAFADLEAKALQAFREGKTRPLDLEKP